MAGGSHGFFNMPTALHSAFLSEEYLSDPLSVPAATKSMGWCRHWVQVSALAETAA